MGFSSVGETTGVNGLYISSASVGIISSERSFKIDDRALCVYNFPKIEILMLVKENY